MSISLHGVAIGGGIAIGRAHLMRQSMDDVSHYALEDDEIVLRQQCLLALHVYIHVRVLLIEVVQGDPLQAVDGLQQLPVGPGALQRRVRENNQNAFHGVIT